MTRLSAGEIEAVRARLRAVLRGPDEVPGDGWSACPIDATAIFAEVPGLSLRRGSRLCAYVHRAGAKGRGVVWVVPEESAVPSVVAQEGRPHDGPRPLGAVLIEGGMEGDGSLASYAWASILIREVDAFAERSPDGRSYWRDQRIIDAPPDPSWTSLRDLPAQFDWAPRAVVDEDGDIMVTLVTVRRGRRTTVELCQEIDWYRRGSYERIGHRGQMPLEIDVDEHGRIASDDPIALDPRVAVIRASGLVNLRRRLSALLRGPESKAEKAERKVPETAEKQRKKHEHELARALRRREERASETTENGWRMAGDDLRTIGGRIKGARDRVAEEQVAHRAALAERLRRAKRLRAEGEGALDEDVLEDCWTRCALDTDAIFAAARGLWLAPGWSLRAYVYRSGGNGKGIVWAMPPGSVSVPLPPRRSSLSPPQPEGAVRFEKALRGDGSLASYLRASLLIREIDELGAQWHDVFWGAADLVGARPEEVGDGGPPADFDWTPRAVLDGDRVTVTFCTMTGLEQEHVTEHVDRYRVGSYERTDESASRALWVGGPGYIH